MKKRFEISLEAYEFLLQQANGWHLQEKIGTPKDLEFLKKDYWLQDTAVLEFLEKKKGMWEVALIFVDHLNPFKFIKRSICRYADLKRARQAAHFMRRQAAKDQRGTIYLDPTGIRYGNN